MCQKSVSYKLWENDGMGTLLLLILFNLSECLSHAQFFCMYVIIPCTLAMSVHLHLCRESIQGCTTLIKDQCPHPGWWQTEHGIRNAHLTYWQQGSVSVLCYDELEMVRIFFEVY